MAEKEIMTVRQVAEYLQMDVHTVYRLARSGQLPSMKIAGQWRFKKNVIDNWIEEGSLKNVYAKRFKEAKRQDQKPKIPKNER